MLAMTTASGQEKFKTAGLYGDVHERLYALNHGTLRYVGFDVLPSFIAWAVHSDKNGGPKRYLDDYREHLEAIESLPTIQFPVPGDFDDDFNLRTGRIRRISVEDSAE